MCFTLCQSDTAFRIADKAGTSEGVTMAYFSHDEAVRQNGVTDEDNVGSVKIAGVEYHYAEYHSLTPTAFDDMHLPRESDALVLEIREATDDKDYQRMTFRTLDKQNAVRQGAACIRDVPLKFGKTYDVTLQTFKSGAASEYTEPLCIESAADEQTSATVNYLTGSSAGESATILSSVYPSIHFRREDPTTQKVGDLSMEYHDASDFALDEPVDATTKKPFDDELRHIENIAQTSEQMRHLLNTLCDDISFSSTEPESGSPLPACLGFTFRSRMNPSKRISESEGGTTTSTYGDFCWKGRSALFTALSDCQSAYAKCEKATIADYPVYDMHGNIEKFDGNRGTLYHPTSDNQKVDFANADERLGGAARSVCTTRKDHMIEFHSAQLYLLPISHSSVLSDNLQILDAAASTSRRLLDQKSLVDAAISEIVDNANYTVREKRVADTAADRHTFLKRSMLTVVGNKLAQSMRDTSLYRHIDQITSQAFACGEPELTTEYTTEGGVYADVYTMNFSWKNVLEVSGEDVVDSEIKFAFGQTQESAMMRMREEEQSIQNGFTGKVGPYSYPSTCRTDAGVVKSNFEAYTKVYQVCTTGKSMTWITNPQNAAYTRTLGSDSVCEAEPMHISFTGRLADFLDLTNPVAPEHMIREDHAGAYAHKTQLLMRQTLHLRTGNTVQRDFFYPIYIKTLSNQVLTFSAQSAVLPSAISRLKDVTVQYDHATLTTVIEAGLSTCVSQPIDTPAEHQYTLVNPIYGYDKTRLNPSFSKTLRQLGMPRYAKLSDGVTETPGALAEVYLLNADDSMFDSAPFNGVHDERFDAKEGVECILIQQTDGDQKVPGTDVRFTTDATNAQAYQNFEFNCFDRVYACSYDNEEGADRVHIRLGGSYIVRSGKLFTVDPLSPDSTVHATTVSMVVTSKSASQSFDISMKIDVPKELQDTKEVPTWSGFHAKNGEGLDTLRQIVDGSGIVSNRVERENVSVSPPIYPPRTCATSTCCIPYPYSPY
ncbi:hypothetical protein CYMTET_15522 [Cymbomonas tetramitiformis]|uniref:Uncharacterized protein n=1 Tax=Cymbomonas tetramitiformis TaxID=36881 RepID=A0AAE0L994_9CHLO|nr:hypothetical protein CYMTET_15522 [Cymbomonas tetramitiformis]